MSRLSGNTKKVSVYGRKAQSRVVNRQTAFTVLNDGDDPFGFFPSSNSSKTAAVGLKQGDDSDDSSLSFQSANSSVSNSSSVREVEICIPLSPAPQPLRESKAANVAIVSTTPKASKVGKRSNVDSPATVRKPRKTVSKAKAPLPPQESTPPPPPSVPATTIASRAPRRAAQAAKMAIEDYDFSDRDMTPRRPVPTKSYFVEKARQLAQWAREDAEEEQALALQKVSVVIPVRSGNASPRSRNVSDTSTSSVITISDSSTVADSSQSSYSQATSDSSVIDVAKSRKSKTHVEKRATRRINVASDDEADDIDGEDSEEEDPTMQLIKSVRRMTIAPSHNSKSSNISVPGLTELLHTLSQTAPESFEKLIVKLRTSESRKLRRLEKLGEASYSEVFRLGSTSSSDEALVMKVIPITMENSAERSDDSEDLPDTSPACDVRQEIRIMQLLDSQASSAIVSWRGAYVTQGKYPAHLLKAWDRWDVKRNAKNGQGAENIRPDCFSSTQLYAVLIMSDGGPDLESFRIKSWTQAAAIFWQVTSGLSELEERYAFEHRDLHWGNILVHATEPSNTHFDGSDAWLDEYSSGVRATIIDFTLSRATITDTAKQINAKQVIAYQFEDESIFQGQGDPQYDVYRQMREITKGDWTASHPMTNVLWLRYLIHQLIQVKCRRLPIPPSYESRTIEFRSYQSLQSIAQLLNTDPNAALRRTAPVSGRKSVFVGVRNTRRSLAPSALQSSLLKPTQPVQSASALFTRMHESALHL